MPQTTLTPARAEGSSKTDMSAQLPVCGTHTVVQLTFSLEIASIQLTPTLEIGALQLKATSNVVSMRLAALQEPKTSMNVEVTFEVANITVSNGTIATVRLVPTAPRTPVRQLSPSSVSALEFVSGKGDAPLQLTPLHPEQASVQLIVAFEIAAIEFTPSFEVATIILKASSTRVSMQLPGVGPSTIHDAAAFEIDNVQLGPGEELGMIRVTPARSG
jgi:hypothetical protein